MAAETITRTAAQQDAPSQPRATTPLLMPLLVNRDEVAQLCDRSVRSIARDDAAGRLPRAVTLGGSKKYKYAEILAWIEAGCPDRKSWEKMKKAK